MTREEIESVATVEQLQRFADVLEVSIKGGEGSVRNSVNALSYTDAELFCTYLKAVKQEAAQHE